MSYVIREKSNGRYLQRWQARPTGEAWWTPEQAEAMRIADMDAVRGVTKGWVLPYRVMRLKPRAAKPELRLYIVTFRGVGTRGGHVMVDAFSAEEARDEAMGDLDDSVTILNVAEIL